MTSVVATALLAVGLAMSPGTALAADVNSPASLQADVPPTGTHDTMIEGADGQDSTTTNSGLRSPSPQRAQQGQVNALATLFSYSFDFRVNLRGRDMTTGSGRFCNNWSRSFVERSSSTFFRIDLWRNVNNAPDQLIRSSQAWNPRVTQAGQFCSSVPDTRGVYYYVYVKTNDTGRMVGSGNVTD